MPRILLTDDQPQYNAEWLERCLTEEGHAVRIATDAEQALTLARAWKPDLILMDIRMAPIDGLEAIRQLKADEALRAIPVIGLSSYAATEDETKARAAGADDYERKPVRDLDRFLAKIQAHLTKRASHE